LIANIIKKENEVIQTKTRLIIIIIEKYRLTEWSYWIVIISQLIK
jgi:hypothetical protein